MASKLNEKNSQENAISSDKDKESNYLQGTPDKQIVVEKNDSLPAEVTGLSASQSLSKGNESVPENSVENNASLTASRSKGTGFRDVVIQLQHKLREQQNQASELSSKYHDLEVQLKDKDSTIARLKEEIASQKEAILKSSSLYAELYKSQNIAPTSRRKSRMSYMGSLLEKVSPKTVSNQEQLKESTTEDVVEAKEQAPDNSAQRRSSTFRRRKRANTESKPAEKEIVIEYKLDPELEKKVHSVENRLAHIEIRLRDLDQISTGNQTDIQHRTDEIEKRLYKATEVIKLQRYPAYEKNSLLEEGSYARSFISPEANLEEKKEPTSENYIIALIRDIYTLKMKSDIEADYGHIKRQRLPDFIHGYFAHKYHLRGLVDQKMLDLLHAVDFYRKSIPEVELFGCFLEESRPLDQLGFFLYCYAWVDRVVYGIKVPVDPDNTVTQYICLDRAVDLTKKAMDALQLEYLNSLIGQIRSRCILSSSLSHMKSYQDTGEHIGEINPNWISVTDIIEFLLAFYVDCEQRHFEKLSLAFKANDRDKDGFITFEEFSKIILQFDPFWCETQVLNVFRKQISKSHSDFLSYERFMELSLSVGFIHGDNFSLNSILNGVVLAPELRSIHSMLEQRWESFKEYCNLLLLELTKSHSFHDQSLVQQLWFLREKLEVSLTHENTGAAVTLYRMLLHSIYKHQETVTKVGGNLSEDYYDVEIKTYEYAIVQQLLINYPKIAKIYARKPVEEQIPLASVKEKVNLSEEEKTKIEKELVSTKEQPSEVRFDVGKTEKMNSDYIEESEMDEKEVIVQVQAKREELEIGKEEVSSGGESKKTVEETSNKQEPGNASDQKQQTDQEGSFEEKKETEKN